MNQELLTMDPMEQMEQEMQKSGFEKGKDKLYVHFNKALLLLSNKIPAEVDENDVKIFLLDVIESAGMENAQMALAAVKYLYEKVMDRTFLDL